MDSSIMKHVDEVAAKRIADQENSIGNGKPIVRGRLKGRLGESFAV